MKRVVLIGVLITVLTGLAYAHGKEQVVLGTVKAVSANAITVEVAKLKETKTITFTTRTKFVRGGTAATWNDVSVGERVAITVDAHGDEMEAHVVRFGVSKLQSGQKARH